MSYHPVAISVSNPFNNGNDLNAETAETLKLRTQTSDGSHVSLHSDARELIINVDPFEIGKGTAHQRKFLLVDASDIVSYLVLQTSFITAQQ